MKFKYVSQYVDNSRILKCYGPIIENVTVIEKGDIILDCFMGDYVTADNFELYILKTTEVIHVVHGEYKGLAICIQDVDYNRKVISGVEFLQQFQNNEKSVLEIPFREFQEQATKQKVLYAISV